MMFTIAETVNNYSQTGIKKAALPIWKMLVLGIMSGIFIGFAGIASTVASFAIENPGLGKLVSGAVFPVGLCMIILTGAELFTGNCLMTISVLEKKIKLSAMAKNLLFVYIGNFIGCLFTALILAYCCPLGMGGGALAASIVKTAAAKCSLGFGKAFFLGVGCNMLVVTAVIMAMCAKSVPGKALCAFIPIFTFVLCGFEHSIANMYYISAGIMVSGMETYKSALAGMAVEGLGWGNMFIKNLLPVTLGNILGGCAVAVQLWACNKKETEK